jgi:hypothetical protein
MWELFLAGMWIVFKLNFVSNLLFLYELDCWNDKVAIPTVLSSSVVLSFLIHGCVEGCGIVPILFEYFSQMSHFVTQTFCFTYCLGTINERGQHCALCNG